MLCHAVSFIEDCLPDPWFRGGSEVELEGTAEHGAATPVSPSPESPLAV